MKNFVVKKYSYGQQLEQIFPVVEVNIMWGKLNFKVLRKLHTFRLFQTILSKILINFSKKSSQSSAKNLGSFEDSLASENEPKMDLQTKIFEASLQHCDGPW